MHILLVDDDAAFRTTLEIGFETEQIATTSAPGGDEALAALRAQPRGTFDAVLLDVEMPGMSGWDLLYEIREAGHEVPVLFVSGLQEIHARIKGLDMGADDFLTKPVAFDELLARVRAVVRRRSELTPLEYGDLRLDLARRRVHRAGTEIDLSPREYDILYYLVRARGEVVSRAELYRDVWNMDFDPGTNVLDVHLGRLRRKIDRLGRPLIFNERGKGFRARALPDDDGAV